MKVLLEEEHVEINLIFLAHLLKSLCNEITIPFGARCYQTISSQSCLLYFLVKIKISLVNSHGTESTPVHKYVGVIFLRFCSEGGRNLITIYRQHRLVGTFYNEARKFFKQEVAEIINDTYATNCFFDGFF